MSSMERRRTDVPGLPPGWKREEVARKSGLSVGKIDVYYISPDGRRVRNKLAMAQILGRKFDAASFDFRSGRMVQQPTVNKPVRSDANIVLPIRQTASVFKQPVTVIRNHPESSTRTDIKHGNQEPPRQLLWEKRLEGLSASGADGQPLSFLQIPHVVQGMSPELMSSENLLQGLAAALHLNNQPVTGQTVSKALLQRNPAVNMCIDQPLVQSIVISENDIARQELKVREARKRLQNAMAAYKRISLKEANSV